MIRATGLDSPGLFALPMGVAHFLLDWGMGLLQQPPVMPVLPAAFALQAADLPEQAKQKAHHD